MKKRLSVLLVLFFGFVFKSTGQNKDLITKVDCDKIIKIDVSEYLEKRIKYKKLDSLTSISKQEGEIHIPTKDLIISFKDDLSDENYFEYEIVGKIKKNWIVISGETYNQIFYYLINQNDGKIDTISGYPNITDNKIICNEGLTTDGDAFIEYWQILQENRIKLLKKFSLVPCEIYDIYEIFIRNDYAYVKHDNDKYFKIKI